MIEVCIIERSLPFISGAWGNYTVASLSQMEEQLNDPDASLFEPKGLLASAGPDISTVKLLPVWSPDWYEENGGVPTLVACGYWEFSVIAYERLKEPLCKRCGIAKESEGV